MMAEVFVRFADAVAGPGGQLYIARACGAEMDDGRWQGWIEFDAIDGSGTLRSGRETTQPNRSDLAYWATGLTPVYLEGALNRTLQPGPVPPVLGDVERPVYDEPRPRGARQAEPGGDAVLDPFFVYRNGEQVLRQKLAALAGWHLVNIVRAYDLPHAADPDLDRMTPAELTEIIVDAVREGPPVRG